MRYSVAEINQMTRADFVDLLGDVFEETSMIAERVWPARPFADVSDLHQKMVAVMTQLSPHEQLALIRAHPELGSKAKMAKTSVQEQASTGLNQLNDRKYERFQTLNQIYRKKFGFPFVMAVKGHTTESIQTIFEQRLGHDRTDEIGRARLEISKIARFRLDEMIER